MLFPDFPCFLTNNFSFLLDVKEAAKERIHEVVDKAKDTESRIGHKTHSKLVR